MAWRDAKVGSAYTSGKAYAHSIPGVYEAVRTSNRPFLAKALVERRGGVALQMAASSTRSKLFLGFVSLRVRGFRSTGVRWPRGIAKRWATREDLSACCNRIIHS